MAKKSKTGSSRGRTAKKPAAARKLRVQQIKYYGWAPDLPDHRDQYYKAPMAVHLPAKVDLRPQCPPVYDQGQLGSCTGNAIAGAIHFDRMKQGTSSPSEVPSRLFIYFNERVMERTVGSDSGAQIRDGIKSVNKLGACFEGTANDQWRYDVAKFAIEPPAPCYATARGHQVVSYQRLDQSLAQMKGCLASGYPFVFGFTCYDSFESAQVARTGVLNLPAAAEKTVGGHAVMCAGYDDGQNRFIVRNSWGKGWGMKGYFTMPYDYLTNNDLADDFWTIRVVEA
ncbi:MAG TPA: C1 family peptidase [Rhizomicrobium sp.]|nr:C1 family peptidase [Rhizomicrobium sp.]